MSVIRRKLARVLSLCVPLALPCAGIAALALNQAALARQDTTRLVVPLSENVQIRCGSGVAWYPVASVGPDVVLRAYEESDGWVRVEYPLGTPIVVKSEEAEVRGSTVVLTRRSRLRAYNPSSPVLEECYKAVFDQFLLPGVEMKRLGEIKTRDGASGGLLVEAPPGASGFVLAREVRPATPAEADRFASRAPAVAAPTRPVTPPSEQPTQVAATPEHATSMTSESEDTLAADDAPYEAESAPMMEQPEPGPALATTDNGGGGPVGRTLTLKELDTAFEAEMRAPISESDPQELIEQFRAYQAAHSDEHSASSSSAYLATRIQALELRARAKALNDTLNNLDKAVQQASENYAQSLERLAKGREYKVVGRLLPSTVYDGKRLPLMYRLTSIDSASSRTLAYVAPEAALDLDKKVGAIVGVLGEVTPEPASMVSVIRPVAVDVLQPSSTTVEAQQ